MKTTLSYDKLGINSVQRSDCDLTGYEVCWDRWPVVSQVPKKDLALVKALLALRIRTLRKNNRIISKFTIRT